MPVRGVGVGSRAQRCTFCDVLYMGMGHAVSDISRHVAFTDLGGDYATRGHVESTLEADDPILFLGGGHGLGDRFTGQDGDVVMNLSNADIMRARICMLHSCLTAQSLGPAIIEQGGLAYCGYAVEWTWIQDVDGTDPWNDYYASSFWRAALGYYTAVGRGSDMGSAHDATVTAYDAEIDEWYGSNDDYAFEILKWLAHDKNGLRTYGDTGATVTGQSGGGYVPPTRGSAAAVVAGVAGLIGLGMLPFVL